LTLPALAHAQFTYTTNNGTITITKYTGPGGDVAIPDTIDGLPVTSIGYVAFASCPSLTSVTIPDSITSIGNYSFYNCDSLTAIMVAPSNPSYSSVDGVLFNRSQTTLIQCPGGRAGSYTIPDTATSIGSYAFAYCGSLTSVTIPESVTSIGSLAFYDCTSLTAIMVDMNNPAYSSVDGVLFSQGQTTLIQCPGSRARSYTIPDSVACIGYGAFGSCTSLTSVTIPESVTIIGSYAFTHCSSLTSVTIPNSVTIISNDAFSSCRGLTNVMIGNSVTNIGEYAFHWCRSLTSVTIPDSVTGIGHNTFGSCTSLSSVTIGKSVTSIGSSAFYACINLTSITIPNSVTIISNDAFIGCEGMTNVTIGHSVTSIGRGAFGYCTSLTSVTIPDSVTSIGSLAFSYCTNLTGVCCQGNAPSDGGNVFSHADKVTVYYLPGTTGWGPLFSGRPTALWTIPPVADASATEAWLVSPNGLNATTLLDGSRSYDPDGDALEYFWSYSPGSEPPTLLATGVVAVAVLPVGSHSIDLVVSDGVATSTNSITVSVLTTGQAMEGLIWLVDSSGRKGKPLMATLGAALASIERGNSVAAANQLRAFEHKVRVQVADPALAGQLLEAAQQVIDALSF